MAEIREVELRFVLQDSAPGVRGGIQLGSGSSAMVEKWQEMTGAEAVFTIKVQVNGGQLPLRGKAIQKDGKGRFLYIVWRDDSGCVNRRAKIYVESIDQSMIDGGKALQVLLPGKAKDGLPCCATVIPIRNWSTID